MPMRQNHHLSCCAVAHLEEEQMPSVTPEGQFSFIYFSAIFEMGCCISMEKLDCELFPLNI